MYKNGIWLVFALVFLVSCQSTRFMQDDMYFTETDAIREVREFENRQVQAKLNKNHDINANESELIRPNDDYYDYSYSSRLRRFNSEDNTWGYYDPYYTNYYWYNNSKTGYFGNSVYSTYTWWGPNFSSNYSNSYWDINSYSDGTKGWINPWRSSHNIWRTPYNQYVFNGWNSGKFNNSNLWNTGIGFTCMYYNSFDNNCYGLDKKHAHNFSALMRKNGIEKDVSDRPEINYTAIRESRTAIVSITDTNVVTDNSQMDNTNPNVVNRDAKNGTANKSITNSSINSTTSNSNNTTTTTKRWDYHNADLNIAPNSGKADENSSRTSRSGIYSEGSRNNNYVYKGSAIPNKGSNIGKQNKGK